MLIRIYLLIVFSMSACIVMAQANSQKGNNNKWQPLFAADLSDASYPAGIWMMDDGVLTATADQAIWSGKQYSNFVLDLDFKTAHETNSGVIVYCSDTADWIPNSVEIQIADDYADKWSTSPKTWQCGAIFGRLAATKQKVVKKPGEWNHYSITCQDKHITIHLNGEKVTEIDMNKWTSGKVNPDGSEIPQWLYKPLSGLTTKGFIGLQGKHAGAPIWFRNMKVRSLD